MSKTYITVNDILKGWGSLTLIKIGICITLFSVPGVSIQAAQRMEYFDRPLTQVDISTSPAFTVSSGDNHLKRSTEVAFFMERTFSIQEQLQTAFEDLCLIKPVASNLQPAFRMISEGIGEILAEKVSVSCDVDSMVLNVAYRLPGDMLLSISKPINTMDDRFVMFNLFHLRELLISDTAEISFLSTYIHNAERRIVVQ